MAGGCAVDLDPASGDDTPASVHSALTDPPQRAAPRHCVSSLDGDRAAACYETFTEAIAVATGGKITDAPAQPPRGGLGQALKDRLRELAPAPGSTNVIEDPGGGGGGGTPTPFVTGIIYVDYALWGHSWVFKATKACDGNQSTIDYAVENLNTAPYDIESFNDSVSSFEAFSNCGMVLYEHWKYQGAATNGGTPIGVMYEMGIMEDEASSIRWY